MRRLAVIAVAAVAPALFAGCSGSSTTHSSTGSSSTTAAPKRASAWVNAWKSKLVSDYGPAQQAFLAAIQGARVLDVQAAAQKVATANDALRAAITAAGPPPESEKAAAAKLVQGLGTELAVIREVLRTCTGSNQECQAALTSYAENNSKQIVPSFTALGAMS